MSSRALIVGLPPSTLGSDVTELGAVDQFNGGFSKAGSASASVGEDVVVDITDRKNVFSEKCFGCWDVVDDGILEQDFAARLCILRSCVV
jgi:hypothetical protein